MSYVSSTFGFEQPMFAALKAVDAQARDIIADAQHYQPEHAFLITRSANAYLTLSKRYQCVLRLELANYQDYLEDTAIKSQFYSEMQLLIREYATLYRDDQDLGRGVLAQLNNAFLNLALSVSELGRYKNEGNSLSVVPQAPIEDFDADRYANWLASIPFYEEFNALDIYLEVDSRLEEEFLYVSARPAKPRIKLGFKNRKPYPRPDPMQIFSRKGALLERQIAFLGNRTQLLLQETMPLHRYTSVNIKNVVAPNLSYEVKK